MGSPKVVPSWTHFPSLEVLTPQVHSSPHFSSYDDHCSTLCADPGQAFCPGILLCFQEHICYHQSILQGASGQPFGIS